MAVLGPGTCLDGFVAQFSSRYTPSDTRFMILTFKSAKFHPPGTLPEFPKALPELLQTLPKLSQAPPEPRLGQTGAREGFGSILERSRALKYDK